MAMTGAVRFNKDEATGEYIKDQQFVTQQNKTHV